MLFDVQKFQTLLMAYFDREKELNITTRAYQDESFPILRIQLLIISFKITQLVVLILSCSYFLGIFWIVICRDIMDWQNIETYDVYNQYLSFYSNEDYEFIEDL